MPSLPPVTRRSLLGGAVAAGTLAAAPLASATSAYAVSSRPPGHVILLALDGFDLEYLDGRLELPHLRSLVRRGSVTLSRGVMTSITNPSWTAISCGTYPDRTQNAAYWFDPTAGVARGQSRDSAVEGLGQSLRRQGVTIGSAQWFILENKGRRLWGSGWALHPARWADRRPGRRRHRDAHGPARAQRLNDRDAAGAAGLPRGVFE